MYYVLFLLKFLINKFIHILEIVRPSFNDNNANSRLSSQNLNHSKNYNTPTLNLSPSSVTNESNNYNISNSQSSSSSLANIESLDHDNDITINETFSSTNLQSQCNDLSTAINPTLQLNNDNDNHAIIDFPNIDGSHSQQQQPIQLSQLPQSPDQQAQKQNQQQQYPQEQENELSDKECEYDPNIKKNVLIKFKTSDDTDDEQKWQMGTVVKIHGNDNIDVDILNRSEDHNADARSKLLIDLKEVEYEIILDDDDMTEYNWSSEDLVATSLYEPIQYNDNYGSYSNRSEQSRKVKPTPYMKCKWKHVTRETFANSTFAMQHGANYDTAYEIELEKGGSSVCTFQTLPRTHELWKYFDNQWPEKYVIAVTFGETFACVCLYNTDPKHATFPQFYDRDTQKTVEIDIHVKKKAITAMIRKVERHEIKSCEMVKRWNEKKERKRLRRRLQQQQINQALSNPVSNSITNQQIFQPSLV